MQMSLIYLPAITSAALLFAATACSNNDFNGQSGTKNNKKETPSANPEGDGTDAPDAGDPQADGNDGGPDPATPPEGDSSCIPKDLSAIPGWIITLEGDLLKVSGDSSPNVLKAVGNDTPGTIIFSGSSDKTVTINCGKKLVISGNGGADDITIGGIKGLTSVEVNGDDGNDKITLTGEGDSGGIPITINGGAGDDQISVTGSGGYGGVSVNGD